MSNAYTGPDRRAMPTEDPRATDPQPQHKPSPRVIWPEPGKMANIDRTWLERDYDPMSLKNRDKPLNDHHPRRRRSDAED